MCQSSIARCEQCGQSFKPHPSKSNKFCCMACYRIAQKSGKYKRGTNRHAVCAGCGVAVSGKSPTKDRSGKHCEKVYCSRGCYDTARAKDREARLKPCRHCSRPVLDAEFCGMECKVAAGEPNPCTCKVCGVTFSALQIRRNSNKWYVRMTDRATCSRECHLAVYKHDEKRKAKISAAFSGVKHPNWQGGTHRNGVRGAGWNKIAEECRERHGRKCAHCGISEQEGIEKKWGRLQVHHKKPFHQWRNKKDANKQSNLVALCKPCHTKADWQWRKENPVQLGLDIYY